MTFVGRPVQKSVFLQQRLNSFAMQNARIVLEDSKRDMRVRLLEDYLTPKEAADFFQFLQKNTVLHQEKVKVFGKLHTLRRRAAAFATDPALSYRYAGKITVATKAPPPVAQMIEQVSRDTGENYNFVLYQVYDDGEVGIGWHSDDERDIAPDSTIASLSLGATRDFQLREKVPGAKTITVPLRSGTLLTMEGQTQRHTKHCVPKRVRQLGRRINLTFRRIVPK